MNKQLYEKIGNEYKPINPMVNLDDIVDSLSDKNVLSILLKSNHYYVEYSTSNQVTRNKVPLTLRRKGLWITYNNGNKNITECFVGNNNDVVKKWAADVNWNDLNTIAVPNGSINESQLDNNLKRQMLTSKNFINYPDNEDLMSDGMVLKFKDKVYDPNNFSGLGEVILRKNIKVVNNERKNILTQDKINKANTIYVIKYDFDLGGEEITIPDNCVLKFEGGSLSNGAIIGVDTDVYNNGYTIFTQTIELKGTWFAKKVNSDWFSIKDDCILDINKQYISGTNNIIGFKNLFKFPNIEIKKGTYYIKGHLYITLDNQNINGNNAIIKSEYESEYGSLFTIEYARGVKINNLHLIGCKKEKEDITEWAHGIRILSSNNIIIDNITSELFRGDGLYIGAAKDWEQSHNISIKNIKCLYNHRQGLSITAANGVIIEDSEFSYTEGTAPHNGIDIEPNPIKDSSDNLLGYETCEDIYILRCKFKGNFREDIAIASFHTIENVKNIIIDSCNFLSKHSALIIWTGSNINITNCNIYTSNNGIVLSDDRNCSNLYIDNVIIESEYDKNGRGIFIIGNTGGTLTDAVFQNISIIGFKSYGISYQGYAKTINNILYNNVIIKNCFHSFYQTTGKYINYKDIKIIDGGKNINGEEYFPGEFHYDLYQGDDISTRKDLSRLLISGSSSTRPEDDSSLSKNHILIKSNLVPSEPFAYCKDFNNNVCEFSPVLLRYKGNTADRPSYAYGESNKGAFYYDTAKKVFVIWGGNGWYYSDGNSESYFKSGSVDKIPSNPMEGFIFYCTTINKYLFYYNGGWKDINGYDIIISGDIMTYKKTEGDSSSRPTNIKSGFQYFDTTLNKPIWWTGTKWVDATGADV